MICLECYHDIHSQNEAILARVNISLIFYKFLEQTILIIRGNASEIFFTIDVGAGFHKTSKELQLLKMPEKSVQKEIKILLSYNNHILIKVFD